MDFGCFRVPSPNSEPEHGVIQLKDKSIFENRHLEISFSLSLEVFSDMETIYKDVSITLNLGAFPRLRAGIEEGVS